MKFSFYYDWNQIALGLCLNLHVNVLSWQLGPFFGMIYIKPDIKDDEAPSGRGG